MTKTIVIIEDDNSFLGLLEEYLKSEGFNVISENNGENVVDIYKANDIDLFIIDVLLPRKNGFSVVEDLKSVIGDGKLPLIMMSGFYKGFKHKNDAIGNFGAKAYLEKPFDFDADLKTVLLQLFKDDYPTPESESMELDPSELLDSVSSMMIEEDEVPIFAPAPEADSQVYEEESELGRSIFFQEEETISGEFSCDSNDFGKDLFPNILLRLNERKLTGELYLQDLDKGTKKLVYIKDGIPIFVKSTLVSECLGNILVEERLISSKDKEKSLIRMKRTRKPQGLVLREMKCLTLPNLKYGLRKQLEVKLKEIFSWSSFKYQFKQTKELKTPPIIHDTENSFAYTIYSGVTESFHRESAISFYKIHAKNMIKVVFPRKHDFLPDELFYDEVDFLGSLSQGETLLEVVRKNSSDKEGTIKKIMAFYFLGMIKL